MSRVVDEQVEVSAPRKEEEVEETIIINVKEVFSDSEESEESGPKGNMIEKIEEEDEEDKDEKEKEEEEKHA